MKKRILSLTLVVIMLLNLVVPAFAAESPDHDIALVGTAESFYGDVDGITFDMQIQGPAIGSTASVIIKIDTSKLHFVTFSNDSGGNGEVSIHNN